MNDMTCPGCKGGLVSDRKDIWNCSSCKQYRTLFYADGVRAEVFTIGAFTLCKLRDDDIHLYHNTTGAPLIVAMVDGKMKPIPLPHELLLSIRDKPLECNITSIQNFMQKLILLS